MDKKRIMQNKKDVVLDTDKLKKELQKLVADFKAVNGWQKGEQDIETSFTFELLKLLGWDKKDWVINTGQDVQTGNKPDIILKSESSKLLVIESKEASKKDKLDGAYQNKTFTEQLFGYCEAEGLYWGVLTNFVEWRLYAVTPKRLYKEKKYAFHDLLWEGVNKASYTDLLSDEGLDFLRRISRQSLVAKNGKISSNPIYYPQQLDLEQDKIKKEFFSKIKNWRAKLKGWISRNYASSYNVDEIDLMSQKILDRMIFMDICHDKGVINENHIEAVLSATKRTYYDELKEKFKLMDEKFNTELFAAHEIDNIKITNEVIALIIRELNDIDFSKLSVHIIGEVYENYLGELAKSRTTDEKKISDKQKQKRKSQGIYYTPDYIVDYIVKNTVGELLARAKTTAEIEKIRVLDPACGSGSFLIRAFDEFYNAYQRVGKEGGLFAFELRKKILQKNLFGVDLDAKAVEITKLNLMIKALEGVKPEDLKGTHLLPNLNLNIRCGNSLIGGEKLQEKEQGLNLFDNYKTEIDKLAELKISFYKESDDHKKKDLLAEISKLEEVINKNLNKGLGKYFSNLDKVNPFNYTVAFCEIFKDGGFDALIGNPPWVTVEKSVTGEGAWDFYKSNYKSVEVFKLNYFPMFIEMSLDIIKERGFFGMIVPNRLLDTPSYKLLREQIVKDKLLNEIVDLPSGEFEGVVAGNIILILNKHPKNKFLILRKIFENNRIKTDFVTEERSISDIDKDGYVINLNLSDDALSILKKIDSEAMQLKDAFDIHVGMMVKDKDQQFKDDKFEDSRTIVAGRDFQRYALIKKRYFNPEKVIVFGGTKRKEKHEVAPKILVRKTGNTITSIIDNEGIYAEQSVYLVLPKSTLNILFVLGILNSNLINFYFRNKLITNPEAYPYIQHYDLEKIPIKKVETQEEIKTQGKIIDLVDEILKLNKTSESRDKNKTRIEAVDYEIDQLVYGLYGLGEEDKKIIEGK